MQSERTSPKLVSASCEGEPVPATQSSPNLSRVKMNVLRLHDEQPKNSGGRLRLTIGDNAVPKFHVLHCPKHFANYCRASMLAGLFHRGGVEV